MTDHPDLTVWAAMLRDPDVPLVDVLTAGRRAVLGLPIRPESHAHNDDRSQ